MDTKRVSGLSVEQSEIEQTREEVGQGPAPGAVVVGGDYQGLGILRSLGRRGVPVCVVDDEHSISRYSKYCTHFVKVARLERRTAPSLTRFWALLIVWDRPDGFSIQLEKSWWPLSRAIAIS